MNSGLRAVLNAILTKTKTTFESQLDENKDVTAAMRKSFLSAVSAAATPHIAWGSVLERDIAIRLNRDSTNTVRGAVSAISETQFKLGRQVAALSKAIISDKLDKAEEVLMIKKLDMIPPSGTYGFLWCSWDLFP